MEKAMEKKHGKPQDGAPSRNRVQLPYKWPNSMVYGRYNELVNGDYFMVYKPTFASLGPILQEHDQEGGGQLSTVGISGKHSSGKAT